MDLNINKRQDYKIGTVSVKGILVEGGRVNEED
jgi:hypothetical protein